MLYIIYNGSNSTERPQNKDKVARPTVWQLRPTIYRAYSMTEHRHCLPHPLHYRQHTKSPPAPHMPHHITGSTRQTYDRPHILHHCPVGTSVNSAILAPHVWGRRKLFKVTIVFLLLKHFAWIFYTFLFSKYKEYFSHPHKKWILIM